MIRRVTPLPRPVYRQTYPEHLATAADLQQLGLRPGSTEPDAILKYDYGYRSGLCALYARSSAVPISAPAAPAPPEAQATLKGAYPQAPD